VVRSLYQRFSTFDVDAVNTLLAEMQAEAMQVVAAAGFGAETAETRTAFMRYVGQGHEIPVPLPARVLTGEDVAAVRAKYDAEYTRFYDRPVPGSDVEIMSYAVVVATVVDQAGALERTDDPAASDAAANGTRLVRDTTTGEVAPWSVFDRTALAAGSRVAGPAIIAEDETSTLIGPGWSGTINGLGYILLTRDAAA
jgi:N-methylhydantoinase A